jgi:hypothetical protein
MRCIILANGYNLAAIAGAGIMNTAMVSVPHRSTVLFHLFISFLKKEIVEAGGFREIQDILPDNLKGLFRVDVGLFECAGFIL